MLSDGTFSVLQCMRQTVGQPGSSKHRDAIHHVPSILQSYELLSANIP